MRTVLLQKPWTVERIAEAINEKNEKMLEALRTYVKAKCDRPLNNLTRKTTLSDDLAKVVSIRFGVYLEETST